MKMRKLLILLLLFLSFHSYSQNKNFNESKIDSIIQIKTEQSLKPYLVKIDSLTKQIDKYELNENYYTSALSTQTGIFSLIVTILLVIIGFISYSKFKSEVKAVEKKYLQSIENYNHINTRLYEAESELYFAIAVIHHKEKLMGESVKYFLRSLSTTYLEFETKQDIISVISDIIFIISKFDESDITDLIEHKEEVYKYLNAIKFDDSEILDELSRLRICINEKMKNA